MRTTCTWARGEIRTCLSHTSLHSDRIRAPFACCRPAWSISISRRSHTLTTRHQPSLCDRATPVHRTHTLRADYMCEPYTRASCAHSRAQITFLSCAGSSSHAVVSHLLHATQIHRSGSHVATYLQHTNSMFIATPHRLTRDPSARGANRRQPSWRGCPRCAWTLARRDAIAPSPKPRPHARVAHAG